ncbi:MAG TPA: aldo/keto reductase [Thermodesulfobacteriota bacterium]|nr:aldo/keto reductase [Thermodesulfobacteriota bacterium]
MEKRKLGGSGLKIFPLALGGNVFGWTADEQRSFELLDAFVGAGFDFIDTADVYSKWFPGNKGGESEAVIGRWLKRSGKRKEVIIATKVGFEMAPDRKGLSKKYIFRAIEDSLARLQTDYIDLYQSHTDDGDTPLEETLGAYGELIRQGKVRAIGASNYGPERLSEALRVSARHRLPRYETLQPHYNLYERAEYETKLQPLCRQEGLGVITYYSLASGFLTGKYRSENDAAGSARINRVKNYLNERGFRILRALDEVAGQYNSTPAAVSLAWLIARPTVTAPISSATTVEQLNALIEATRLELDSSAIKTLDEASAY